MNANNNMQALYDHAQSLLGKPYVDRDGRQTTVRTFQAVSAGLVRLILANGSRVLLNAASLKA